MKIKSKVHAVSLSDCFYKINSLKKVLFAPNDFNISFFDCIKAKTHTFTPNEFYWYNLKENDTRDYISDYERKLSRSINPAEKVFLDNKLLFEEVISQYAKTPRVYAYVRDGIIYGIHDNDVSIDNVTDFIRTKKEIVLKKIDGFGGKGIHVIKSYPNGLFYVNADKVDEESVLKLFQNKDTAIICEYMHQSQFSNELYPFSTNTIRIVCGKEKNESKAKVIKAAQRIGNHDSAPVDNVSSGGIACEIDLETGELMQCVNAKSNRNSNSNIFFETHPDTGVSITGRVIPNWTQIKQSIEELTNKFPYLNFVAWDVLLTDDGICLIEGNASSGLMLFQQYHGMRNEKIGAIYRSYGIIK